MDEYGLNAIKEELSFIEEEYLKPIKDYLIRLMQTAEITHGELKRIKDILEKRNPS